MSRSRPFLVPLIVACALFMENLDATVIATALPAIADSFGENPVHLNLAISCYLLSLAVFVPVSGWVADRVGARTVFRLAILVFIVGSVLCGLSGSLAELVLARILQGAGGAMMVPVGRLVLLRSVSKSELIRAMAWLTIPALTGPVLGPPLGGFIVTYVDWQWIFWINVPIGLVGIVLVTIFIPEITSERPPRLDIPGFLLVALALSGLVFGFETVGRGIVPGWTTTALLAVGLACALLFLRHARRAEAPVVDLGLLDLPTFRASMAGGFLFRVGIGALPFLLPMLLQIGFGLSPLESGLLTFAGAVGAIFMKLLAGPILRRFGFRRVLIGNALLCGAFIAAYGLFRPDTPVPVILAALFVGGLFRSLQFTSLNALGYADVPERLMSRATSFASMAQQLSLAVGVGIGALALHVATELAGSAMPGPADFTPAFLLVGLIAMLSALPSRRLPAEAGAEIAGRTAIGAAAARRSAEPAE